MKNIDSAHEMKTIQRRKNKSKIFVADKMGGIRYFSRLATQRTCPRVHDRHDIDSPSRQNSHLSSSFNFPCTRARSSAPAQLARNETRLPFFESRRAESDSAPNVFQTPPRLRDGYCIESAIKSFYSSPIRRIGREPMCISL